MQLGQGKLVWWLGVIGVCATVGALVALVGELDTRWLIYGVLGLVGLVLLLVLPARVDFLLAAFVLSLQAYVSVRLLFGYAGTDGIEFPLAGLLAMLVCVFFLAEERPQHLNFGGPMLWPLVLYSVAYLVSLAATSEQFAGLVALIQVVQLYVCYWVGLNVVNSPQRVLLLLRCLFVIVFIQGMVYLVQAQLGFTFTMVGEIINYDGVRAGGTIGANSSIYAGFMLFPFFVLTAFCFVGNLSYRRLLWSYLLWLLCAITMGLTLRRGAWLGIAVAMVPFIIFGYRQSVFSRTKLTTAAVLLLIAAAITPQLVSLIDEIRSGNPFSSALDERWRLMEIAWDIYSKHPLTGIGPGAYGHVFKEYVTADTGGGWLFVVHNYYLLMLVELGPIGAVALVGMLYLGIRQGYRLSKFALFPYAELGLGLGSATVAYSIAIFWEPMSHFLPNALLWFLLGVLGALHILANNTRTVVPPNVDLGENMGRHSGARANEGHAPD